MYFTETVDAGTDDFTRACDSLRIQARIYPHPKAGPHGEPLATAVCRLGRSDAANVLVVVSGTHGIEGHAGSAIQLALLDAVRAGRFEVPDDLGVVLVHQINPWGCAWNRRENEDNVDIFRNLIYTKPPYARNELYGLYDEGINPRAWTGPERKRADEIYARFVAEHGEAVVIATIRRGQHEFPRGMTFHGDGPSWSRRTITAVAHEFLGNARRIGVCDIHTGYGDSGELLPVSYDEPGSPKHARLTEWLKTPIYVPGRVPLIPSHPRMPYDIFEELLDAPQVTAVGAEFGTYDVGSQFDLLRASSCVYNYGDPRSEFGQSVASRYRELFYPNDPAWRQQVVDRGLAMVERLAQGVAAWR